MTDNLNLTLETLPLSFNLQRPIVLEEHGHPLAVVMSYEIYQQLTERHPQISASQARQAADHMVFGDLVGCALSSGEPIFAPMPCPHWRVPYRFFDGTLLTVVTVDAYSATVSLTNEERHQLLDKVEHYVTT